MLTKHAESHLDHALTEAQVAYILDKFADRSAFFIETFELPADLGTVPCGLHGPIMGDAPVAGAYVGTRGDRTWTSQLTDREPRQVRQVTVIAGPHKEDCKECRGSGIGPYGLGWPMPGGAACQYCVGGRVTLACILYTAFGGPAAPQEPGDPNCRDVAASKAFWSEHALSR